jgi:SOS-response transcriptional repressor LexA
MKLTARQAEALQYVKQFLTERSYSPSFQDIADGMGVCKSTAREYALALWKKGFIDWTEEIPRSMRVLK